MTHSKEWEARAEYLRLAALRIEDKAAALKIEADGLRTIANHCEKEAIRLSLTSDN